MRVFRKLPLLGLVLCGFVTAVGLSHAHATSLSDPKIQIFQIENLNKTQRCSATLIPHFDSSVGFTCRLLTNAHCVSDDRTTFKLSSPAGAVSGAVAPFFGKVQRSEIVSVKNLDRGADLAELSVPASLQKSLNCNYGSLNRDLDVEERAVDKNRARVATKVAYYSALGFHGGRAVATFAEDGDWGLGIFAASTLYRARTSLTSLEFVFNFVNLPLHHGMSGGATIDSDGNVVGINVRLVQFQDESFVIPLRDVLRFLDSKASTSSTSPTKEKGTKDAGENTGAHGGENSGAHGGENTGAHGGENTGAHGGENTGAHGGDKNKGTLPKLKSPLSSFIEPEEGVDVQVDGVVKRLLGIGHNQIDGFDDLRAHANSNEVRIYRNSAEFLKLRRKIFIRFEGDYRPVEAVVPDVRLSWKPVNSEWTPLSKGQAAAWIVVKRLNDRHAEILLNYVNAAESGVRTIYRATLSDDRANIEFVSSDNKNVLKCDNENYLKLICSSPTESISLSLLEVGGRDLSFRSSRIQADGSVRYVYGRLQRFRK